jgi:hypothetical protein
MLPTTLMNGYQYRFFKRLRTAGILTEAKRIKVDPLENVSKAETQRQVYCITKRKFYAMATKAEAQRDLVFLSSQNKPDREEVHRILQFKLR